MAGRPSKLTPQVQAAIVQHVEEGAPIETACQAEGIGYSTLRDWIRWGGEGREPFAAFSEAYARARAKSELDLIRAVRDGDDKGVSNGPARGAQWLLERTRGKRYAARVNVKVEEETEMLLDVVERVCSRKDCGCHAAILEALASRDRGEEAEGTPGEPATELH